MKSLLKSSKIIIFAALFCASAAFALPSYDELINAPKSLAKDYYIDRYAQEKKLNTTQLRTLRAQIYRYAGKIKTRFDKIIGPFILQSTCKGELKNLSQKCQRDTITQKYLIDLNKEQREYLANYFKDRDYDLYVYIKSYDLGVDYAIKEGSDFAFFKHYYAAKDKNEMLNLAKFSPALWANISNKWAFVNILNDAVILGKNEVLRQQLLALNPSRPHGEAAFLAGINAILYNDEAKALRFFNQASRTPKNALNKDAALFWMYLINKDETVLNSLAKSSDINMYSLYAHEMTDAKPFGVIVPNPKQLGLKNYDITDPFTWERTKAEASKLKGGELVKFAAKFYTKSTLGEYCYLMERAYNYKKHYYPLPFMDVIGTTDAKRQALILALGRQESRFVPGSVSTSYALGMMQFMPFLARDIGHKKLKIEGFDESDMFKPAIAYSFANYHLNYLEKYLQNPIFIAYAYNGGIGFTKRMLLEGKLFSKNSAYAKYEPFLSMELVPLSESRDYAKKVLANYIIYRAILGSSTKISLFFESLMIPADSDSFRSN